MTASFDEPGVEALLKGLLAGRDRYKTEGNVTADLGHLLVDLGVDHTEIESEHSIPGGGIDLYLPRYRVVIEAKAAGLAADPVAVPPGREESPRDQMERYTQAVIAEQLQWLPFDDGALHDRQWTGIVTDGRHWHIYHYPHADAPIEGRSVLHSGAWESGARALALELRELLEGNPVGRKWIPTEPATLFERKLADLDRLHEELPETVRRDTRTKQALWHDMLRVSGMSPQGRAAPDRLFVTHTFLIVIARMVTYSLNRGRLSRQNDWRVALQEGFAAWVMGWPQGERWSSEMWGIVSEYDWRQRRGDVLRSLYETFVPEADRRVFGEFYTPDWLAAMIVEQALDDQWLEDAIQKAESAIQSGVPLQGIGVLDPACGSGTFLYHAARRILGAPAMEDLTPVQKSNVVALLLNGLDVHPVAVEVAKANLMRVLPVEPTDGESAIRVYLGDSLLAREEEMPMFSGPSMRLSTPQGKAIEIPMELVQQDTFGDSIRRLVRAAVDRKPVPSAVLDRVPIAVQAALQECRDDLVAVIGTEGNSVWAWYAMNVASPYLLALRKVNRIVANPPWVKLAHIQEIERKRVMEALGTDLNLQAGGKQAPHLDIAAYFVLRSRDRYLNEPDRDPAVWLVKKSALKAGNWKKFREQHRALVQSVDLEALRPFGSGDARKCCLLMEIRAFRDRSQPAVPQQSGPPARRLIARMAMPPPPQESPPKPRPVDSWSAIRTRISLVPAPALPPQVASEYHGAWRQGATVVPHVLLVADEIFPQGARTRVRTRRSVKSPWNALDAQDAEVPARWISRLYTSADMLPFLATVGDNRAIIPVNDSGDVDLDSAMDEFGWVGLNEVYRKYRGQGKTTPKTLAERINFHGGLTAQPRVKADGKRLVLYPASADIMRAARTQPRSGFVDSKLYWLLTDSVEEAGYLTAILNAPCLSYAFAESRESGRDFHLHPFNKVPVPRYDAGNSEHVELARLCEELEKEAEKLLPILSSANSKAIREGLATSDVMVRVNRLVANLLPQQAGTEADQI